VLNGTSFIEQNHVDWLFLHERQDFTFSISQQKLPPKVARASGRLQRLDF